jgi:hypothetical protein
MTDATLLTDRGRPAVRLERHLPDPPAVVWQALTEREQLRSSFPSDVIVEGGRWEIGATITFPFPPEVIDMTLTGEILEVDEPNVPGARKRCGSSSQQRMADAPRPHRRAARRCGRRQRRRLGDVPRPPRGPRPCSG